MAINNKLNIRSLRETDTLVDTYSTLRTRLKSTPVNQLEEDIRVALKKMWYTDYKSVVNKLRHQKEVSSKWQKSKGYQYKNSDMPKHIRDAWFFIKDDVAYQLANKEDGLKIEVVPVEVMRKHFNWSSRVESKRRQLGLQK